MNGLRFVAGVFASAAFAISAGAADAGLFTQVAPLPVRHRTPGGLSNLKHLIFIVQENRSFDNYFGTYPGADGIPTSPPCQVDPWYPSACDTPYPNHDASNMGGPYMNKYQVADIDGGKMDGFVASREKQLGNQCAPHDGRRVDPRTVVTGVEADDEGIVTTTKCTIDVMGYHDGTDLPNYWKYAADYVLFDHFYESAESWSLPAHLALYSGWAAKCTKLDPPIIDSCYSQLTGKTWEPGKPQPYLWTDITYLLYQNGVSWLAYLDGGLGKPIGGNTKVQGIWAALGGFETVVDDGQYANAVGTDLTQFYSDAAGGTLPAVSWILPQYPDSEHPQASIAQGQSYVTGLVNAIESGPDWNSSAIFIVWDDIGGFYDHEPPPFSIDFDGPGLRVPALLISPYALTGTIDHQILTTDSFLKLIEDTFLNGESMAQSGRPDPRPDYRDQSALLGNLENDFDFQQAPRPPVLLSTHPMSLLREDPAATSGRPTADALPRRR
jgi:phospholipase C